MDTIVVYELIAVGLVFILFQLLLGGFLQKWLGAVMLGASALVAVAVSAAGIIGGYWLGGDAGAWWGLGGGFLLTFPAVAVGVRLLKLITGIPIAKGIRRFMIWQWIGFVGLAVFGHLVGGWIGLLTISLPAALLFWTGLLRTAEYTLPIRDQEQRRQLFRSLLTFTMGTNYPYYFLTETDQLHQQVEGDSFQAFFAGPGIVYTNCDHAVYITNGIKDKVGQPGLNFTGVYDLEPRPVDLRPQFRKFSVPALTKDDIKVDVELLMQFKIDTQNESVKLGQSFPFNEDAVRAAVMSDLVDHDKTSEPRRRPANKYEWDGQRVEVMAEPIVQDIISQYTLEDLFNPVNPRHKITQAIFEKLTQPLQESGIKLLSGEIGNLTPQDEIIIKKRLEDWRTKWESKILGKLDDKTHHFLMELDQAKTEADFISVMARIAENSKQLDNPQLLRLLAEMGGIIAPSRRRQITGV